MLVKVFAVYFILCLLGIDVRLPPNIYLVFIIKN